MPRRTRLTAVLLASHMALAPALAAQAPATRAQNAQPRITVSWTEAPVAEVLRAFAAYSGRSIVAGTGVGGLFCITDDLCGIGIRAGTELWPPLRTGDRG